MSFEAWFRIVITITGIVLALMLARDLITGRVRLFGRLRERVVDAPAYWQTVGMNFVFLLGFAAVPLLPDRAMSLGMIIGMVSAQLLEYLVFGEVPRSSGRIWRRADGDRAYWRWIAFYGSMLALFIFVLVAMLLQAPPPVTTP